MLKDKDATASLGVTRQGDVHLTGKSKAAWFKDPDGNIIALVGR